MTHPPMLSTLAAPCAVSDNLDPTFDVYCGLDTSKKGKLMFSLLRLLIGFLLFAWAVPSQAATFTVNSTLDHIDGDCTTPETTCTLRAAFLAANATPGADTIIVPAGTYTLDNGNILLPEPTLPEDPASLYDLDILDDVTIIGAG